VRVSAIEPGVVATELQSHMREEARQQSMRRFAGVEPLEAEDIADAIEYVVTRPRRVALNELLIRPTNQEG
jgi:NADP-dependent 3-hydroxy acid dehydrogenase YdfG